MGSYNHRLYCLGMGGGAVHWQFSTQGMLKGAPLVTSQGVFLGSYDKRLYRLSHAGRLVWSCQPCQGSLLASPLLLPCGTALLAASLCGAVAAVALEDGSLLWSLALGKPIFGTPLVWGGGRIVVPSTQGCVICVSPGGEEVWRREVEGPVFSSPITTEGGEGVLVGDHSGAVTCLDGEGGVVWSTKVGDAVAGAVDCGPGGRVVVATTQGELVVLGDQGDQLGRSRLPGEVFSSPLLLGDRLVVGCRDDFLYCLNISSIKPGEEAETAMKNEANKEESKEGGAIEEGKVTDSVTYGFRPEFELI